MTTEESKNFIVDKDELKKAVAEGEKDKTFNPVEETRNTLPPKEKSLLKKYAKQKKE